MSSEDGTRADEPLRVLQVVTDRDRRGSQVYALDLAPELTRLGCAVDTVALAPGRHGDSLEVEVLGPRRRSFRSLRALRRHAKSSDVVIAHGSSTLLACALALAGTGRPFVYRQVSDPLVWARSWPRRLRVAAFIRRAAHVVALSDEVAEAFAGHYWLDRDRFTVVPNAVPGSRFRPPSADERAAARRELGLGTADRVVVTVASLSAEKGIDVAIEAVASQADVRLVVVGDGPERSSLERMAQELLGDRVTFVGAVEDPRAALWAADVAVMPSRSESMPAAVIEASLCGLPVVASDVGSVSALVVNGTSGILVAPGEVPPLAVAVQSVADDIPGAVQMGLAGAAHCRQHFTIEATASRWMTLLKFAASG